MRKFEVQKDKVPPKMKILSVLAIISLSVLNVMAQKTTKNNFTGAWEDNNSWMGGVAAQTANIDDNPADLDLTINGYITRNGGLSFANVNADATGPDFIINDTLVVKGDLTFANLSANLVLGPNAVLVVMGNFDATNKILVSNGGILVVTGTMSFSASGNDSYDNSGGGELFAGGPVTGNAAANTDNDWGNLGTLYPVIAAFVGGTITSLPVELNSLHAIENGGQVNLSWSTASQLNFNHFEVEHSMNARDWDVLTSIAGEGTTNELKEYSYTHNTPQNGKNYYRLRMVDLDETYEYSDVVSETISIGNMLSISPNPTTNRNARYTLNFTPSEGDQVLVYDLMGTVILVSNVISFTDELVLPSSLTKGTYLVRYRGQSVNQTQRLVVE